MDSNKFNADLKKIWKERGTEPSRDIGDEKIVVFSPPPTHKDFRDMKKDLKLNNFDIAVITGLTEGSVKTLTKRSAELPAWVKSMIYVWKKMKEDN